MLIGAASALLAATPTLADNAPASAPISCRTRRDGHTRPHCVICRISRIRDPRFGPAAARVPTAAPPPTPSAPAGNFKFRIWDCAKLACHQFIRSRLDNWMYSQCKRNASVTLALCACYPRVNLIVAQGLEKRVHPCASGRGARQGSTRIRPARRLTPRASPHRPCRSAA